MRVFYKPADGYVGDTIPFFWNGEYHIFYLKDPRGTTEHGDFSWSHIGTRNFVNYTDYGEALPRGTRDSQDDGLCTGCVIEKDGVFHIFYPGNNKNYPALGKSMQVLMHATSDDLIHWTKDPGFLFPADGKRYDLHDADMAGPYCTNWRDPFVFLNEESGDYWMLVTAATVQGPYRQKGCLALCTSRDLVNWELREPFWAPGLGRPQEVPDLFRIGDWWYVVYSRDTTQYRMSRSLSGPWLAPPNETFDGGFWYAGKTASDGKRRLAFAWNPTRAGETDAGPVEWGGHLVVHELVQQADGRLAVKVPREVDALFREIIPISPLGVVGEWEISGEILSSVATDSFAWCNLGETPNTFRLKTTVRWEEGTRGCGVVLRADEDLQNYYQIRLEPHRQRVVFDSRARPSAQPFGPLHLLEQPVELRAGEDLELKVLVEDSVIVAYVNDKVALSARGYDHKTGAAGAFVSEGSATFMGTELERIP